MIKKTLKKIFIFHGPGLRVFEKTAMSKKGWFTSRYMIQEQTSFLQHEGARTVGRVLSPLDF